MRQLTTRNVIVPQGSSVKSLLQLVGAFILLVVVGVANANGDLPLPCANINAAAPAADDTCLAYIESAPRPDFDPIPIDYFTLDGYQYWRAKQPGTPLYSAPNGSVVGRTSNGLVYIRAKERSADGQWLRSEEGQWLRTADLQRERPSEFRGVQLGGDEDGELRPFAWVLKDAQPAASPGGAAAEDAPLLQRYDLVYTFASVEDEEGARWYLIGAGQWLPAAQLAVVLPTQKPRVISRDRWLSVDLTQQVLLGYWQDTPQFATLVSSGIEGRATPLGVYEIWARLELDSMSGFTGAPDAYGLESVPWVLYYDESIGFHGTYWHDGFGAPLSHGCVNLSVSDSAFVYQWTVDGIGAYGTDDVEEIDTQVYVYRSGGAGDGPAASD